MKILFIISLLLCSMFISPSQTTQGKIAQDTTTWYASTKYFEWRKKMMDDTGAARHARWCNLLQQAKEETDSLIAAYRYRQWVLRQKKNKD